MRSNVKAALTGAAFIVLAASSSHASREESIARYREGLRLYRIGNTQGAIAAFRQSEDADPSYAHPAFALGRIYQYIFEQQMTRYEEAAEQYRRVGILIRAEPPSGKDRALLQTHSYLGLLYLRGGEYAKALDSLETFLKLEPAPSNLETIHNAIGIAQYYLGQYDQAVQSFRRAISVNPDNSEARFNLRSVFTRLAVYNEALAIARAGDYASALEKLKRLKEFAPRYIPGRRLEAKLLQALGKSDDGLRVYREVLGFNPADPATYAVRLEIARILEPRGQREEAARLLRENLERFPDAPDPASKREVIELLARMEVKP